jgi:hypothetical protein
MTSLLRKTTQTTYTFSVSKSADKEYLVTIIKNDNSSNKTISCSISVDGVEVEDSDEREQVLKNIESYTE